MKKENHNNEICLKEYQKVKARIQMWKWKTIFLINNKKKKKSKKEVLFKKKYVKKIKIWKCK